MRSCSWQFSLKLIHLQIEPWWDTASDGAKVDQGDKEDKEELPCRLLELHLTAVPMDGSPCGSHQQSWWDYQEGQGCHHQGHQTMVEVWPEDCCVCFPFEQSSC